MEQKYERHQEREPRYKSICLMFAYGEHIKLLDRDDFNMTQGLKMDGKPLLSLSVNRRAQSGYDVTTFRGDSLIDGKPVGSISVVVSEGRKPGVSWVAPTAHAAHAMDPVLIEEQLGLLYPSPESVNNVQDKGKYH